jgi:hypothetical protein
MKLKKVLKAIKKTESKLKKQNIITDERTENHLINLKKIALELTKKEKQRD